MRAVTQYIAFDGKTFETADACKAYEATNLPASLVAALMPPGEEIGDEDVIARVNKALTREDRVLADLLEKAGNEITKKRLADGEKKRNIVKKPEAATPQAPADPTSAKSNDPPPPPSAGRGFGRTGTEG